MWRFHTQQHMIPLHTQQPRDMTFDRFNAEAMATQPPTNWCQTDIQRSYGKFSYPVAENLGMLSAPPSAVPDMRRSYGKFSYSVAENLGLLSAPPSPVPSKSMKQKASCRWTQEEKSLFHEGLKIYGKGNWKSISGHIKSRSPSQVASHAQKYFLRQSVPKVTMQVPNGLPPTVLERRREILNYDLAAAEARYQLQPPPPPIPSKSKQRKRFSEVEHRLFLIGLKKYGKGNWRNISEYVGTRTQSQVVSHAQKYFLRQNALKKRKSINDITIEELNHSPDPHLSNHHDSAQPLQNGDLDMTMKETNDQVMVAPQLTDHDDFDFNFDDDEEFQKFMDEIPNPNLVDPNNSFSTTELDSSSGCCNTFSFHEVFDN